MRMLIKLTPNAKATRRDVSVARLTIFKCVSVSRLQQQQQQHGQQQLLMILLNVTENNDSSSQAAELLSC